MPLRFGYYGMGNLPTPRTPHTPPTDVCVQGYTKETFFIPLYVAMEMVTVIDECDRSIVVHIR